MSEEPTFPATIPFHIAFTIGKSRASQNMAFTPEMWRDSPVEALDNYIIRAVAAVVQTALDEYRKSDV